MGFSLLPREDEYFSLFSKMADKIEEASAILVEMIASDADDMSGFSRRIKDASMVVMR